MKKFEACVVVAHPDDETIWAGGTILLHPQWRWTMISLCRGSDRDRAPRFYQAAEALGASAVMADLDDGPEQARLSEELIQQMIISRLPVTQFDLILTHSPFGEYTRHRRHEEIGAAVGRLWVNDTIYADELWMFAYRDCGRGGQEDTPIPISTAHRSQVLPEHLWWRKQQIITSIYGFAPESYEARIVQRKEAFWRFTDPLAYQRWLTSQKESL